LKGDPLRALPQLGFFCRNMPWSGFFSRTSCSPSWFFHRKVSFCFPWPWRGFLLVTFFFFSNVPFDRFRAAFESSFFCHLSLPLFCFCVFQLPPRAPEFAPSAPPTSGRTAGFADLFFWLFFLRPSAQNLITSFLHNSKRSFFFRRTDSAFLHVASIIFLPLFLFRLTSALFGLSNFCKFISALVPFSVISFSQLIHVLGGFSPLFDPLVSSYPS